MGARARRPVVLSELVEVRGARGPRRTGAAGVQSSSASLNSWIPSVCAVWMHLRQSWRLQLEQRWQTLLLCSRHKSHLAVCEEIGSHWCVALATPLPMFRRAKSSEPCGGGGRGSSSFGEDMIGSCSLGFVVWC